jgi:hypothetical protein
VAAAIRSGHGTSLIRQLIPHELGGNVDLVFASEGACCKIEFPLKQDGRDLGARQAMSIAASGEKPGDLPVQAPTRD